MGTDGTFTSFFCQADATKLGYVPSVPGFKVDCGASIWQQNFSFDPFGNITKSVPTGGTGIAWNPGYNAANNRYTLAGTSYDSNGNLLGDTFHTYSWDLYGHTATIDSSSCGTNGTCVSYDAFGRMVEKNVAGTFSEVLYSPLGKTAVMNGSTIVDVYVPLPGQETLHMVVGGQHFWHPDWLGSIRLSSTRLNRTIIFDRAFAPYGEAYKSFSSTANNSFAGDTQDMISGTYDTPNRELNPSQGRWISPDPAGGAAAGLASPQSWNRYTYVNNLPTMAIDPMGLLPCLSHCPGGGGGGGGSWWSLSNFGPQFTGAPDDGGNYGSGGGGLAIERCGVDPFCIQKGGIAPLNDPVAHGASWDSARVTPWGVYINNWSQTDLYLDGDYVTSIFKGSINLLQFSGTAAINLLQFSGTAANNGTCQAPFICNPTNTPVVQKTPTPPDPHTHSYSDYLACAFGTEINDMFGDKNKAATTVLINIAPLAPANYLKGGPIPYLTVAAVWDIGHALKARSECTASVYGR